MYFSVTDVEPTNDYHLILTFSNGDKRLFDMNSYLNTGIFSQLKDKKMFFTVKTSFDTIVWDNEADFDPEVLFNESVLFGQDIASDYPDTYNN